jgi:putative endonuclease
MNVLVSEMQRITPNISKGTAVVYILRLKSGGIYIGASTDLEQRLDDHISGQACRTTLLDPPATLVRVEIYTTYAEARKREAQLKRWSRAKKETLILGNVDRLRLLSQSRAVIK